MSGGIIPFEEYFESALESRKKDYLTLYSSNGDSGKHSCILMHLGGIVVECFLKYLIVDRYNIEYARAKNWYSDVAYSNLSDKTNITKSEYRDCATVENPGHDLLSALKLLEYLNLHVDESVLNKFKVISCPIIGDKSYIDLRYKGDCTSCIDFETWDENFKFVMNWLTEKSSEIEVNVE